MNQDLISIILPEEILNYFEVIKVVKESKQIDLYLDELPHPPKTPKPYISKGFTERRVVQDFPIRGKAVFLHLRRRKWQEVDSGKIITSSYDLHHTGTHLSKEFADFLKAAHRV